MDCAFSEYMKNTHAFSFFLALCLVMPSHIWGYTILDPTKKVTRHIFIPQTQVDKFKDFSVLDLTTKNPARNQRSDAIRIIRKDEHISLWQCNIFVNPSKHALAQSSDECSPIAFNHRHNSEPFWVNRQYTIGRAQHYTLEQHRELGPAFFSLEDLITLDKAASASYEHARGTLDMMTLIASVMLMSPVFFYGELIVFGTRTLLLSPRVGPLLFASYRSYEVGLLGFAFVYEAGLDLILEEGVIQENYRNNEVTLLDADYSDPNEIPIKVFISEDSSGEYIRKLNKIVTGQRPYFHNLHRNISTCDDEENTYTLKSSFHPPHPSHKDLQNTELIFRAGG